MDEHGMPQSDVLELLRNARQKDLKYTEGRILGSMCTSPHEFGKHAYNMFLETNLGDAGLFPGTKTLEKAAVSMMAGLLKTQSSEGVILSGGTEANIIALWAARNLTGKKKIIVPETAHFSFDKACNILGLTLVKAAVDRDKRVDVHAVEDLIDEETCAIVGIAGSTEYGTVDDLGALARLTDETGVYLHIDAAFGGFVLPFLEELGYEMRFDTGLSGIASITIDPHKMGLVPIPCGCILFRDASFLKAVEVSAPYLTQKTQQTLLGTRTGAAAAAAYAVFKIMGRAGYRLIVKQCMENTMTLHDSIKKLGYDTMKPTMNILVFKGSGSLYETLTEKGWRLSKTRNGEIRIVVMPHVSAESINAFLQDLSALTKRV